MDDKIDLSATKLETKAKAAVVVFCEVLQEALRDNLQSINLYGSAARDDFRPKKSDINLLVILERIDVAILKDVIDPVAKGRRWGIAPFFITEENLRASTDVFPVKFLAMQESYRVLQGRDILGELEISREHLRLRCEQEIKNVLLRLRRHYILAGGRDLTNVMSQMITDFLETLRVVVSLKQEDLPQRDEIIHAAAKAFEFDAEVLRDVNALRDLDKSLPKQEAEKLYDKFMTIVERVAKVCDKMN